MAAKSSIAMRRIAALERIQTALGEGFTLPTQGRDPELLYAVQLEAIAEFLEVGSLVTEPANGLEMMRDLEPLYESNGMWPLDIVGGEDFTVATPPPKPARKATRKAKR